MKRNIPLLYAIGGLSWTRLFIPVIALFYIASQVTIEQFSLIFGIFALVILLFEIPSGVLADLLGKKKALLMSRCLYIVEIYILAFYNGFWPLLIAKVISGIGVSLGSGTDQAMMYDTLKRLRRTKEHKKISGNVQMINNIFMAIAFIVGAYLFSIGPKLPAIASLPFITLATVLVLFLKEPYKNHKGLSISNSVKHLKEGLKYFAGHSYVKYLTFYSFPIISAIMITQSLSSAYLKEILVPVSLIGIVAFASSSLSSLSAKMTHRIEEKVGEKKSLFMLQVTVFLGVILMSFMIEYIGAIFYLFISLAYGFSMVLINHYMNEHIETSHRATMLSIKNMFNNLAVFLLLPLVGFIIKSSSFKIAYLVLGIIVLFFFGALALYSRKLRLTQIKDA